MPGSRGRMILRSGAPSGLRSPLLSLLILVLLVSLSSFFGCRKAQGEKGANCPEPLPLAPRSSDPKELSPRHLRVFALGVTVDFTKLASLQSFENHFLSEVAELSPCLSPGDLNLMVYPEDVGLLAALLGPRGELARGVTRSEDAFVSLALSYGKALSYYQRKFPWITQNQALVLALTHTIWASVLSTFSRVAEKAGSYVVVSINAPYPFTVTPENSAPEALTYPELGVPQVYEAVTSEVYNLSLFFDPTGKLLGVDPKRYLVPAEEDLLQLTYGSLPGMKLFDLMGVRVGSVISKDAWMPDVLERLEDLGVQFLVQPEAFSGWTISEVSAEEWLPDVFMESGYLATQLYPGVLGAAVPMLIGNYFDLVFDGQSHITKKASPLDQPQKFVGNPPVFGFLSIGPWTFPDPGDETQGLTLEERRRRLREQGERLLPFSGDPSAGAYRNSRALGIFPLGASEGVFEARHPQGVYLEGKGILVVYDELKGENAYVHYRLVDLEGKLTEEGIISSGNWALRPVLARTSSGVSAIFMQGEKGREKLVEVTFPGDTLIPTSPALIVDTPGYAWWPQVTATADTLYLTWLDGREGYAGVYVARKLNGVWEPPRRVDGKNPLLLRGPRKNSFAPMIAAQDQSVAIAFADFRNYSWDLYLVFSRDGGATFSSPILVNQNAPSTLERIVRWNDLEFSPGTPPRLHLVWNEIRHRKPDPDLFYLTTTDGTTFSAETLLTPEPRVIQGRPLFKVRGSNELLLLWEELTKEGFGFKGCVVSSSRCAPSPLFSPQGMPVAEPALVEAQGTLFLLFREQEPSGAWKLGVKSLSF